MSKYSFLLTGVLCLALTPALLSAASVSITPSSSVVNIGDTVTLTISGSGFTTPLDAGGLDITWDPGVLTLGAAGYTRASGFIAPSNNGTPGSGQVSDIFFFADPAKSGSFNIGTLELRAIAAGSSAVNLVESAINPFAGGGGALPVSLVAAAVTVNGVVDGTATPEPSTTILLGSGIALTIFSRAYRRFNRK